MGRKKLNLTEEEHHKRNLLPRTIQCFFEKSTFVIDCNAIDFSSHFQKHPTCMPSSQKGYQHGHQIAKLMQTAASPIFHVVSIETPLYCKRRLRLRIL
ncbi:hypothetical protein TNCV_2778751 [Trichonephila clavipes]|nr:hypothetical protein TNCV_2778751 [Trichonephila clavipes]